MDTLYSIYKITFEDDFEYVGITIHSVEDRIRRHIQNPDNAELSDRLQHMDYKTCILHANVLADTVYALERKEIEKLEKPINIKHASVFIDWGREITMRNRRPSKKRNVYPPREGEYVCSKCRVKKQHWDFGRDRCRFNGLNSRCKICERKRSYERRHQKLSTSESTSFDGDDYALKFITEIDGRWSIGGSNEWAIGKMLRWTEETMKYPNLIVSWSEAEGIYRYSF